MKCSEVREKDFAIQDVLRHMREVNIQNPEYSAIKKILVEGADGRYLKEYNGL
jgi:hypothetical protein